MKNSCGKMSSPRWSAARLGCFLAVLLVWAAILSLFPAAWVVAGEDVLPTVVVQQDGLEVFLAPAAPLQGQALVVVIRCADDDFVPQEVCLFDATFKVMGAGREYKAVCAVPLQAPTGRQHLTIRSEGRASNIPLMVRAGAYGEERLTLPTEMVSPKKPQHLAQIKQDRELLRAAYSSSVPLLRFAEPFKPPLESSIITPFGRRRILNGIAKSPHGGIDLRGQKGTPVPAAAAGRVALAGRLYYSGNAVIIDHGLDIFSLYLHLDTMAVQAGDLVQQGEIIGCLGSTGRVTGPHLHWGIKVNGIVVDPLEFIEKSRLLLQPSWEG
ncbi:MAG: M23 family metallopeptidase [Deltaproteobacteria bacterium]|nr:M23 family metallopeptidase [Candidatus Anaeroferrophillus wilburensis]MBN2888172.1 M23 family metallopeptidase [Deltaproteobacteria bacterium]